MSIGKTAAKLLRLVAFTLLAVVLLIVGVIVMLYSPWAQEGLRVALVNKLSTPELNLRLDSFSLRFPLTVEAGGVALVASGDTVMAASSASADISLFPLLSGEAYVDRIIASNARYNMGGPDSAMWMRIAADSIAVAPATIKLSDMAITVHDGIIRGGRLSMQMNPDTAPPTKPAPPQQMSIAIKHIHLDDFTYTMRMMPTIDTLSAHIARSELSDGLVDMLHQTIHLNVFQGNRLSARYIAPDSASIAAFGPVPVPKAVPDSLVSPPWTVMIDSLAFTESDALYATAGIHPLPGLDFGYIYVDSLDLRINDFYNRQTVVKVPMEISGRERCGVDLNITGTLDIDSVALTFNNVNLRTSEGTAATFSGQLGMGDMAADTTLPLSLNLDGQFAPGDMGAMFPAFKPYFAAIPRAEDIRVQVDADGTTGHLDIATLALDLNHCISLGADGYIENFMNPDHLGGDVAIEGRILDVNSFKNALLEPATAKTLRVPPMSVTGRVQMRAGVVNGRLTAATKGGRIGMDGRWNSKGEAYKASVKASTFPVDAFMPLLGVQDVTASVSVDGQGYSPFRKSTTINASADIAKVVYEKTAYTDIKADAQLHEGLATVRLESDSEAADLSLEAKGNLDGNTYNWTCSLDGRYIDLYALKVATEPASLEINMTADATIGPGKNDMAGRVHLVDLFYRDVAGTIAVGETDAHLNATDSSTVASVINGDMTANFTSPESLDSLATRFGRVGQLLAEDMKHYSLNVDTLHKLMPRFDLDMHGGSNNLVNNILAPSKMSLRAFGFRVGNDSLISLDGYAHRFNTGSMILDTIFIDGREHNRHFHLNAGFANRPGNLDEWHKVTLTAAAEGSGTGVRLHQEDIKGRTGFDIGLVSEASAADSSITVHVKPYNPIIGYKNWNVNEDNYISYTFPSGHIDANLHMKGDNSSLAIYTEAGEEGHQHGDVQEDLVIQLSNIHLQDWIAVNPFMPAMSGDINADMRLNRHDGQLVGNGSAGISKFLYGKQNVADLKLDFNVAATMGGQINADADVFVNGVRTMKLAGALNDSTATSPLALDLSVIHLPLATANPFLPSTVGKLSGMLNGNLKISGTKEAPVMNGTLDFDSTAVYLAMTGTPYRFSEVPVTVTDNVVDFRDFSISGCNDNPLLVNGTVDISDMANVKMNLSLKADNMMVVNSNRAARGADIFGKGYISLDANAHGSMRFLQVNANLSVNSGTNITYIQTTAASSLTDKSSGDMVKFVNFTDSAAVAEVDSVQQTGMAMMLDAVLTIEEGSTVNVYLSPDGSNRAQIQANGTLTYTMSPLDTQGRLTGRLNLSNGFVRYTPPFMSEKLFTFEDNSWVSFSGDMLNPALNIHAVDVLKANVTGDGQNSRLVNFRVLLNVTGSLDRMDAQFDLATNDDMTVANELESMTPQQRANQAMNLLLYNVYTGPGAKANASLSGNPLFSFLESRINTWAANTIRGVDLSFGIDQYNRTVNGNTSQTMSYSYQVSKSLFNDRFKIAVGGNYSSDADADENFSQNLINDISFEYFLNDAHTMYVRLFRHTGYESILEGEITQTGVGFVYSRKLRRLGDMFLPAKLVKRRIEKQNEKLKPQEEQQ